MVDFKGSDPNLNPNFVNERVFSLALVSGVVAFLVSFFVFEKTLVPIWPM